MKAAITVAPGHLEIRDVRAPEPGPGEVLLAVQVVGICGSDVHLFHGRHPYSRFPGVQGHEFSALVAELGPAAPGGQGLPGGSGGPGGPGGDGGLRPGDLVAIEPLRPCGRCLACRRSHRNCCRELAVVGAHTDGALAEHVVVPAASCYPAGDLPADLAALAEPVSIGLQAVSRARAAAGDQVVILGAGPIGQAAVLAAADRGARVLAVDRLANRLAIAAALGAEVTVDVSAQDVTEAVRAWAGTDGPAVVIEATGLPALIRLGTELVAHSGTVVIVGITTGEVSLPVADFTRKELNVLGSRNNAGLFGEAVDLVRRHRERVALMISHRFAFADTAAALQLASEHPGAANKVLIGVGSPA